MKQPHFSAAALGRRIALVLALMPAVSVGWSYAPATAAPAAAAVSDDEALTAAKAEPPVAWAFPAQAPLHVLAVRGLWYSLYNLNGALLKSGAEERDCWHNFDSLRDYPVSYEELCANHLVILCNINASAMPGAQRAMLKEYVKNGGAVLMLGGNLAYTGYQGTALADIAPVTFPGKGAIVHAATGLTLKPEAGNGLGLEKLSFSKAPRTFWYQEVTPKAGAKVLVAGDGKPLLVAGTYGKGRVAVFAGTVLGDAAAGQLAFWHWDDWQQVLSATIDWLTVPTRKPDAAAATAWRAAVTRDITAARGKTPLERAVLTRYAPLCSERASADLLIRTALQNGADITPDIADLVDMAVRPYIDAKFAPLAKALVGSSLANKASLGLRLLGRSGAPGAAATLIKALESGDVASADTQDDADEFGGDVEDPLERRAAIRKGAIVGLSCLGDSAAVPALRKVMEELRAAGTKPLDNQATVAPERELFGEAAVAATRCGDAAAAADAVGAIIYQRYQLYHLIAMAEQPIQAVGSQAAAIALTKRLAEEGISRQIVRERRMLSRLEDLPAATLPAVAKAVAAETRPCVEGFALSAFGGRTLPAAVVATLGKAHSSEVAAMFQAP